MAVGGVLFDIDGVLTTSWKAIPGAAETLRILNDHQIACSYLTNTTTRTRKQIAEALVDAGMDVRADEVITAALLTSEYVRQTYPDARCFLVNSGNITEDMPGIELVASTEFGPDDRPDPPDVILMGGAGAEYNHLTLSRVYDWMAQGVPVVAMHRSTSWNTTEGLRIDTGLYLIGMEETSGRKATAVGKPAPAGFLAAAGRLGVDPEAMYMVGDDLNNDVLAAQVVGMTGVLVRTGKFRQDTLNRWVADEFAMQPNHVIDSVADLPDLLGLQGARK
jgi:HAD superfamily hydrolase (TIGR01450 family)